MEYSEGELVNYDFENAERSRAEKLEGLVDAIGTIEPEGQPPKEETGQYGERLKYDPAGPFQKARVRTDFCWCIGFLLFVVVWLIIIIYGFSKGDADKWLEPMDSEGRVCGKDPGVEHRPYLVRYNNGTCEDCLICWSSCPTADFEYLLPEHKPKKKEEEEEMDIINKKVNEEIIETPKGKLDITKTTITETEMKLDETKPDEKPKTDANGETNGESGTHEKGNAPGTGGEEKPSAGRESVAENKDHEKHHHHEGEKSAERKEGEEKESDSKGESRKPVRNDGNQKVETLKKDMICKPEVQLEHVQRFPELEHLVRQKKCAETYKKAVEKTPADRRCNNAHGEVAKSRYALSRMSLDLSNTKFSITGFVFISAVIALISIMAMRWFALFFICGSIVVATAVFFYLTYDKIVSDYEDRTSGVLLALFVCILIVVTIVLVVLYLRNEIFKTCKMIKESSKAITGLMWTLLFALLIAFVYGMILMMGVNLYFALSSIETPIYHVDLEPADQCVCPPELGYTQNASCDPVTFDSLCLTAEKKRCAASGCYLVRYEAHSVGFLHFINYVGLYWSFWFVLGFVDSVLANVFSNWYWTFNKNILTYVTLIEGFWIIGFYHLGTVALGSIIILICEIVRCVLIAICKVLEKINQPFTALILMHMRWVYDLLDTFLNFINSRAYVACAMHGTDFLHSARSAYYLMMRNINKVYRVAEISNWLTFMLALLISSVVSKISEGYYESREDEVTFAGVPSFFVFAGSLLVTWLMLRVVEVAVETIYQCFLEDSERNDGSCDKPFFASEQLSKILYKSEI